MSTSLPTLGSTTTNNLSLEGELEQRIGKAATVLSKLGVGKEAAHSKYQGCCVQSLHHQHPLFGSESWTSYAAQECKLNVFHHRCLRQVLGVSWQDKVTNYEVLDRAGIPSMYTLLQQRRLRWLGHVHRMEDGCIPKDLLYGELATGYRDIGCPQLHYKDVCKREMMALQLENTNWESLADNRSAAMFGMCLSFLFLFRLRCLVCVCHFCFSFGCDVWYVFAVFVSLSAAMSGMCLPFLFLLRDEYIFQALINCC